MLSRKNIRHWTETDQGCIMYTSLFNSLNFNNLLYNIGIIQLTS